MYCGMNLSWKVYEEAASLKNSSSREKGGTYAQIMGQVYLASIYDD